MAEGPDLVAVDASAVRSDPQAAVERMGELERLVARHLEAAYLASRRYHALRKVVDRIRTQENEKARRASQL